MSLNRAGDMPLRVRLIAPLRIRELMAAVEHGNIGIREHPRELRGLDERGVAIGHGSRRRLSAAGGVSHSRLRAHSLQSFRAASAAVVVCELSANGDRRLLGKR